jgi:hypothetical protein
VLKLWLYQDSESLSLLMNTKSSLSASVEIQDTGNEDDVAQGLSLLRISLRSTHQVLAVTFIIIFVLNVKCLET